MVVKTLIISLFLAQQCVAAESVSPPVEVKETLENPLLSGAGPLKVSALGFLTFYVYDASLWVEQKPWNFNQKFALTLEYKRTISSEEIVNSSIEEMQRHHWLSYAEEKRYRQILAEIFPSVKEGDRITAAFTPAKELTLYFNGARIKTSIKDMKMARHFIDIWLHDNAHYRGLMKTLRGMG